MEGWCRCTATYVLAISQEIGENRHERTVENVAAGIVATLSESSGDCVLADVAGLD